jgi:hypothetical protein
MLLAVEKKKNDLSELILNSKNKQKKLESYQSYASRVCGGVDEW